MFLAFPWLKIYVYIQTGNFADFDHFKIDSYFTDFEESQNWAYSFVVTEFGQVTIILLTLGKKLGREKQSKPPFDRKFKNHA